MGNLQLGFSVSTVRANGQRRQRASVATEPGTKAGFADYSEIMTQVPVHTQTLEYLRLLSLFRECVRSCVTEKRKQSQRGD